MGGKENYTSGGAYIQGGFGVFSKKKGFNGKLIRPDGTVVTRAATGKPCRLIRNAFTKSWEGREHEIQPFPAQIYVVGREATIRARELGDVEHGSAACGQSAGLIRAIKPARQVIEEIMAEAEAVLARLTG